jgi:deoxyguanosine kinase
VSAASQSGAGEAVVERRAGALQAQPVQVLDTAEIVQLDGPRYIVVEGPIGVGKTSLARRLARSFQSELILEQADENPLPRALLPQSAPCRAADAAVLSVPAPRQIEQAASGRSVLAGAGRRFLLEKDRLFAELTLDRNELGLYEQVASTLQLDAPGLIWSCTCRRRRRADAPSDRARHRVRAADRSRLPRASWRGLCGFFTTSTRRRLLIVNAASIDPVHRDSDYRELLNSILRIKHGRHFFNPAIGPLA